MPLAFPVCHPLANIFSLHCPQVIVFVSLELILLVHGMLHLTVLDLVLANLMGQVVDFMGELMIPPLS
jgi:hypothetical protein